MRRLVTLAALAAAAFGAAAPAAAQQDVYVVRSAPAWLGVSYETRWVMEGSTCTPQIVVQGVVQGSPAERAGLRAGDAIIAVDGEAAPPGRLQTIAGQLVPGDSVRLRFQRNGTDLEVTAVADRRPDRPLSIFVERQGFRTSGSPVIEVIGDSLIARNLTAEWDPGRVRSYWIRGSDGRSEYRTVSGWTRTELDTRVADFLACADSASADEPRWIAESPSVTFELRRLQERADSIRVAMNRRAMERSDLEGVLRRIDPDEAMVAAAPSRAIRMTGPEGGYTLRVEDHVAVGLRGVAGAELTALDPELAEYFRNADEGLLVLRIAPDTPADRAGLRPGDVVIAADGRRVESVAELRQIIALPQGSAVSLRVVRKGRTRDLTLRRD